MSSIDVSWKMITMYPVMLSCCLAVGKQARSLDVRVNSVEMTRQRRQENTIYLGSRPEKSAVANCQSAKSRFIAVASSNEIKCHYQ